MPRDKENLVLFRRRDQVQQSFPSDGSSVLEPPPTEQEKIDILEERLNWHEAALEILTQKVGMTLDELEAAVDAME